MRRANICDAALNPQYTFVGNHIDWKATMEGRLALMQLETDALFSQVLLEETQDSLLVFFWRDSMRIRMACSRHNPKLFGHGRRIEKLVRLGQQRVPVFRPRDEKFGSCDLAYLINRAQSFRAHHPIWVLTARTTKASARPPNHQGASLAGQR